MSLTIESTNPVLDILSRYLDLGFAIVPIWGVKDGHCACPKGKDCTKSPGKHPNQRLAPNGKDNATRNISVLREWVRRYPNGNWALCSGGPLSAGGFSVVIDVDPRNGGDASILSIQGAHGDLPVTATQDTGGNGQHYVLRSEQPCASRAPAPGVEVLGEGKYFLVYPSKHISGSEYTWGIGRSFEDCPIADAPGWVLEFASGNVRPDRDSEDTARETVLGEAFALAGKLGVPMQDGSYAVACPWADEHSDNRGRGEDSSTVILPPAGGSRFGGFSCKHSHCSQRRWQDVMQALPADATAQARRKYPLQAVKDSGGEEKSPQADKSDYDQQLELCRRKLSYKEVGKAHRLINDVVNAITILSYDPRWKGVLIYDDFAQTIRFTREAPWHDDDKPSEPFTVWTEGALNCLDAWFRRYWGLELPFEKVMQAASMVAMRESVNPLRDYLLGLKWDGTKRLDTWLSRYLGSEDNEYTHSVGRKWLVSAVARAFRPGCKADHVLILEGPQGRGKSTALEVMAGAAWFNDTPIDIGSKDAYLALRGKWIVELGELASLRKADVERAKAFFSSRKDTFRPPYGRVAADFPRQCIFAGTVNLEQYLGDETGNRRFWPVRCGVLDIEALALDRDQIWAEAVAFFKSWVERGCNNSEAPWWPSYEERGVFEEEALQRIVPEVWTEIVSKWILAGGANRLLAKNGYLTASEVLTGALDIDIADHDKGKIIRVGIALGELGWTKTRTRHGKYRGYAYKPPCNNVTAL